MSLDKKINDNESAIYHNRTKRWQCRSELIDEKTLKIFQKISSYSIKNIQELLPVKSKTYEYSEFHVVETEKNFNFPIHDDIPNKLLSGYLH